MNRPKQPKSICMQAFPAQFKSLRPENTKDGGVKSRGVSEELKMAVYRPIAKLYIHHNPWCECCPKIRGVNHNDASLSIEVHHKRGRSGLCLFDTRDFAACCADCHRWIHDNPEQAEKLGLIIKRA